MSTSMTNPGDDKKKRGDKNRFKSAPVEVASVPIVNDNVQVTGSTNNTEETTTMTTTTTTTKDDNMNLTHFQRVGTELIAQYKALTEPSPELKKAMGELYYTLAPFKKGTAGRIHTLSSLAYSAREGQPCTMAWFNVDHQFGVAFGLQVKDGVVLPRLLRGKNGKPMASVKNEALREVHPLNLNQLREEVMRYTVQHDALSFQANMLAILDSLPRTLAGSAALVVDGEGDLIGQVGVQNWAYPSILNHIDGAKLHITVYETSDKTRTMRFVSFNDFLGIQAKEQFEDTQDEQSTDVFGMSEADWK